MKIINDKDVSILIEGRLEFDIVRSAINLLYDNMVTRFGTKYDTNMGEKLLEKITEIEKMLQIVNGEK